MFFRFKFDDIVIKTILIIFIYIEKNKLMLSIFTIFMFKDFHNFIITAFIKTLSIVQFHKLFFYFSGVSFISS
jgi:hypothetical protein